MALTPSNWGAGLVLFPNGKIMGSLMYIQTGPNSYEAWDGTVDISFGATSIALNDGVDNDIKATVIDYLNAAPTPSLANPVSVILTGTDGAPYNASGGGGGGAVTIADGADVVEGELADAKVVGDNSGTISAKLRGINYLIALVTDIVNQRINVFVANTSLAVTQSGSWSVTANAGTNLNTSALALESGGNLAACAASLSVLDDWDESDRAKVNIIVGQAGITAAAGSVAANTPRITLASDDPAVAVLGATTGSAVITDANGTIQQYLRGLVKLAITAGSFLVTATIAAGTNLIGRVSSSDETSTIYNGTTALTPKYAVISASSSGNNTIVAAVTSKKIRVIAYNFIANGSVNVKFQSGAGGTDLTGLKYCTTNTGLVAGYNPVGWFETASNTLLNINLSGAVAIGGELVYVEV